jgi:hypothetical protein
MQNLRLPWFLSLEAETPTLGQYASARWARARVWSLLARESYTSPLLAASSRRRWLHPHRIPLQVTGIKGFRSRDVEEVVLDLMVQWASNQDLAIKVKLLGFIPIPVRVACIAFKLPLRVILAVRSRLTV